MINIQMPESKIIYVDRRGNEYDNPNICEMNDDIFRREDLYNYFMKNRNWLEKLFNIKPKF